MSGVEKTGVTSPLSISQPAELAVRSRSDVDAQEGKVLLKKENWDNRIQYWLSDWDDYRHYFLSYGARPSYSATSLSAAQKFSADFDFISAASTTSSPKTDSASHPEGRSATDSYAVFVSSLIERAAGIRQRLGRESGSAESADSLKDRADDFQDLIQDYSRSVGIRCSPTSQSSRNRQRGGGLQQSLASAFNSPKSRSAGKQPVRADGQGGDGETLAVVDESSKEKTAKRIRCFY